MGMAEPPGNSYDARLNPPLALATFPTVMVFGEWAIEKSTVPAAPSVHGAIICNDYRGLAIRGN